MKIAFYGGGNIAQAFIEGLLKSGYKKNNIFYVDRNPKNQKLLKLQENYNNLLSEKQKSDEKCRILQHANDMLYNENNNLKNQIVDIKNNAAII